MTQDLDIWFEDKDEPLQVRADQRDMAAFELEYKIGTSKAIDEMPMTFFRYLGWHAARRLGKIPTDAKREAWLEAVVAIEPPDDEVLTPADPTKPEA